MIDFVNINTKVFTIVNVKCSLLPFSLVVPNKILEMHADFHSVTQYGMCKCYNNCNTRILQHQHEMCKHEQSFNVVVVINNSAKARHQY